MQIQNSGGGGENRTPVRNRVMQDVYMLSLPIFILPCFQPETQVNRASLLNLAPKPQAHSEPAYVSDVPRSDHRRI